MNNLLSQDAGLHFRTVVPAIAAAVTVEGFVAHAGLNFELDLMAQSQEQSYYFSGSLRGGGAKSLEANNNAKRFHRVRSP